MLSHKFDFWRRWNTIASCIVVCLLLCVSTWCGFQGVFGCGLVVLRFRQALAVVLRSCSCASIPFVSPFSSMQVISPCFFCLIVLSGSGSSSPLCGGSVFLPSCNLQSYWSLVLCCPVSVGLWLESQGPIILYQSQIRTEWLKEQSQLHIQSSGTNSRYLADLPLKERGAVLRIIIISGLIISYDISCFF